MFLDSLAKEVTDKSQVSRQIILGYGKNTNGIFVYSWVNKTTYFLN